MQSPPKIAKAPRYNTTTFKSQERVFWYRRWLKIRLLRVTPIIIKTLNAITSITSPIQYDKLIPENTPADEVDGLGTSPLSWIAATIIYPPKEDNKVASKKSLRLL